jgi:hypothetical protein
MRTPGNFTGYLARLTKQLCEEVSDVQSKKCEAIIVTVCTTQASISEAIDESRF